MKSKKFQKILSVLVSVSLTLSAVSGSLLSVNAADSPPMTGVETRKDNQPKFSGYRIWDIRDWSPEEDPGAEFLRAEIPLQARIDPFKPTQANPDLESDAEIMLMQGDYGNSFVDGMMYNNTFSYHTLNFWQYADYFSPWHGAAGPNTPEDLYDYDGEGSWDRGWEKRYFEFGILNIPNPAYTNAAHRNGVKSIACIYFDQHYRPGQTINELFVQDEDGTFPVAEKLIEMADYFGYDGYFFNAEEPVWPENETKKKQFLARLEAADLYTQYYNTNSTMNASKAEWLEYDIDGDGVKEKIQDSVFVNYSGFNNVDSQMQFIEENGYDPFKQVFFGVEANQGKFSGSHNSVSNLPNLYAPGTKNPRGSIALFTPSDFYQRSLPDDNFGPARMINDPDYQWMIAERERMYFSGVLQDPTNTGKQPGFSRPEINVKNGSGWVGVADFTSERSVIAGTTFYSTFNTGKGRQFFTDGEITNQEDWSNINIQSILPTWQWWFETPDKTSLSYNFVSEDEGLDTDVATPPSNDISKDEGLNTGVATPPANNASANPMSPVTAEVATTAAITISPTMNGTIEVDHDDLSAVPIGATVRITATPDLGYVLAPRSIKVNGKVNTVMSFKMPAEDVTIEGAFKLPAYDSLKADFDYGEKYHTGATRFEKVGAYNGGSSLVLAGGLEATNTLRLFKTDLKVTADSKVDVTYFKPTPSDGSELGLGLIFEDSPEDLEIIPMSGTGTKTSKWTTKTVDISRYADREIATIALVVNPKQGAVAEYQINIGEIRLTDGTDVTPAQPTGFKVDRLFTNDELIVTWDMEGFDTVDNYEIYAELSDGTTLYCGGIYDNIYYIKTLLEENDVASLKLYAIGKDGSKSEPATIDLDFTNKVSNVQVTEATTEVVPRAEFPQVHGTIKHTEKANVVSVSWDKPTVTDYKGFELTLTMDDSTDPLEIVKTVAKGADEAELIVPRAHGEAYNVAVKTILSDGTKTDAVNVTGKLKDVYIEPYDVSKIRISGSSVAFMCPDPTDWLRMYVNVNGVKMNFSSKFSWTTDKAIRAATMMSGSLPSENGVIEVVLEDYSGNFSEPAYLTYYSDPDAEIDNTMIPDPELLAAVKAQAGTTVKQVLEFNGTLNLASKNISDFTGLSLLANVEAVDLSNSTITSIDASTLQTNAKKLIVKNNTSLKTIMSLASMANLKELDITGCTSLEIMNVNDSKLEKLIYGDTAALSKLTSIDMSGAKFDLSAGTPERAFVDAMLEQTAGKADVKGTTEMNISVGKTANTETTTVSEDKANKLFDGGYSYFGLPRTYPSYVGISYDEPVEISSWKFLNDTFPNYGLSDFKIQYSNDATTWQTLGEPVVGCTDREVAQTIANPVSAKHYRLEYTAAQSRGPDVRELELYAYPIYQAGVKYDGQRPEISLSVPETAELKVSQGVVDASTLISGTTVRGTDAKALIGQDFIDPDYDVMGEIVGAGTMISVEAENGEVNLNTIDTSTSAMYTVTLTSFATSAADGEVIGTISVKVGDGGIILPVVKSVKVTPDKATVRYGAAQQFKADVVTEGNAAKTVTWSVSGNNTAATKISQTGLLTVGEKETSTALTVKAVSSADRTKQDAVKVTVIPYTPAGDGNSSGSSGSSGGSTPAPAEPIINEGNNKIDVTVKDPETTIVGNKAEILVPEFDTSKATESKPMEVLINVPSDKVVDMIKSNTGSQVSVDIVLPAALLNKANVSVMDINMDKDIFKQAKESGKQVTVNIKDTDGKEIAVWTFDGKNIANILDINLSVELKASTILPNVASTFKGNANTAVVRFHHDGLLPGQASVNVNVSNYFAAGDILSVYYNNTATGKLEKVADGIVVDASGKAKLNISHCSDYVLVKTASGAGNEPSVVAPSVNPQTSDSWWSALFA